MMFFATRFPFSTAIKELKFAKERFLCLNGYQVWQYSWLVIIIGTIGQLVALWLPSFIVLLKILLKTR
jgi:roadblock/LC7 domain-containing protein